HWIKGILIQEILPAREGFRSWFCRKKAGLELLGCPDFCAAEKRRVLVHDESRRFDVTAQGATSLKFAAFGRVNIYLYGPPHCYRFRPDFAADGSVLLDCERSCRSVRPINLPAVHLSLATLAG